MILLSCHKMQSNLVLFLACGNPEQRKDKIMQTDPFETYRSLLFAIAYRMVGSAMEAEDIVQEAYLHYRATPPESIRTLKGFLTTVVHRLCLDHLKSAQVRREQYVGPWLPEPLLTGDGAPPHSPLRQVADRESISMAFLVLLERLSPLERSVFLLREVFEYEYAEIAQITGRSEAACRQLFSRAKKHIREHRPRFSASPQAHEDILNRFMEVFLARDIDGLMNLLAEDVTVWVDSGGKVTKAVRHPIQGRHKVARATLGLLASAPPGTTFEMTEINGLPALLLRIQGQIAGVLTLEVAEGVIQAVHNVANPDKLAHLELPSKSGPVWRLKP